MTGMSVRAMEWLEARGLDIEIADRHGLYSHGTGSGEVLVYPISFDGKVVRRKFRALEPREGRARFWAEKGGEALPFNADVLRDNSLISRPLIITEGYEDCMAVEQAAFPRVISVPDGAPENPVKDLPDSDKYQWIDKLYQWLKLDRVKEIILAVDGDAAGAALMHDLSIRLIQARCKFVTWPRTKHPEKRGRERCKDMNEVLEEYGVRGVAAVLERAVPIRVNGVYRMSELPPLPEDVIYGIGFDALGEHFRMRLGDLSVWTGIPSHGKTTMLNDIICRVVSTYGVRAAWASFEQEPQRDHRRALRSWHAEEFEARMSHEQKVAADAWIDEQFRFLVPDDDEDPTLEWLIEKMEAAVIQHGCKIIIVDPWNEAVHERDPGESETDYTNRSLRTLSKFAKRFRVHLAIVAHPTKLKRNEDGTYPIPSAYDISGSAAWYNKPVQVVIVHRPDEDHTMVKVQKSRYHEILGKPGIVKMAYVTQTRRYSEVERGIEEEAPKRRRKSPV